MSNTDTAADTDPELDAALLAHDTERAAYIYRRLAIRRRMAVATFLVFLLGGVALIVAGLSSDAVAKRVMELGTIIATFMMALAGIVSMYWGCGAYEQGGGMFGGGSRSSYGGYGGGFGASSFGTSRMTPRLPVTAHPLSTEKSSRAD